MHVKTEYLYTINEDKNKGKVSQNTTCLLDVNETTCFSLLGHHQVAKFYETKYCLCVVDVGPPLWSSGQSFWLQIQGSRVRFPALPDFLSSSGSGTGSPQPREVN